MCEKEQLKSEIKSELKQDEAFREELKREIRDEMLTERRAPPGESYDDGVPQKPEAIWIDGHPIGWWLSNLRTTHTELSERVTELEEEAEPDLSDTTSYEGIPESELTWMERFYHLGREGVNGSIRKRDIHAKMLLNGLPDWAFRANHGAVILPTAGKLKEKLGRAICERDEEKGTFEYAELYRACEALQERSDGKVRYHEDHPKIGRHLRVPEPDALAVNTDIIEGPPGSKEGKQTLLAMR